MFWKPKQSEKTLHELSGAEQQKLYGLLLEKCVEGGHLDLETPLVSDVVRHDAQELIAARQARRTTASTDTERHGSLQEQPMAISGWQRFLSWWLGQEHRLLLWSGFAVATLLLLFCAALLWRPFAQINPRTKPLPLRVGRTTNKATPALYTVTRFATSKADAPRCLRSDDLNQRSVLQVRVRDREGQWRTCAGVVVGAHAVLTTSRCRGDIEAYPHARFVLWRDKKLFVSNAFRSPFVSTVSDYKALNIPPPRWRKGTGKGGERPFAPYWFLRAKGARRSDPVPLPTMHDLHLFFVPELTPDFLHKEKITIAKVDAFAFSQREGLAAGWRISTAVHVIASNGDGGFRVIKSRLRQSGHKKGMLSLIDTRHLHMRDVGSPVFGVLRQPGNNKDCATPVLLGIVQSPKTVVPLAYHPQTSIAKSPETYDATRRNHLWLTARLSDMDNDGLFGRCDPDPVRATPYKKSRCVMPLGMPRAAAAQGFPMGLLLCGKDEVVAGIRGRYSIRGVARLALLCRPRACLFHKRTCLGEYWTDTYGGTPSPYGKRYTMREKSVFCPQGQLIQKFDFEVCGREICFVKPFCAKPGNQGFSIPLPSMGGVSGRLYPRSCPTHKELIGLVVASWTFRRISSVQVLCRKR